MKKIITIAAIIALLSGCTSRTEFGECVGVLDNKKPNVEYKLSVWNTVNGCCILRNYCCSCCGSC